MLIVSGGIGILMNFSWCFLGFFGGVLVFGYLVAMATEQYPEVSVSCLRDVPFWVIDRGYSGFICVEK